MYDPNTNPYVYDLGNVSARNDKGLAQPQGRCRHLVCLHK